MADQKIENEYGDIIYGNRIIVQLIVHKIEKYKDTIWITNSKGRRINTLSRSFGIEFEDCIEIYNDSNEYNIEIYIMLRFGKSITDITNIIFDDVCKVLKENLDIKPNNIAITITGTISKNVAKRNIRVSRHYD